MNDKPSIDVYKADLQRVGTIIPESMAILSEYLKNRDWDKLRVSIINENILKKRSTSTVLGIVRAVKKRFFEDHSPLPPTDLVASAMVADIPETAKVQIMYAYVCETDALVKQAILSLVKSRLQHTFSRSLAKEDVINFIREESVSHQELRSWSEYLVGRWARGFLALLRDFGIMTPAPKNRLLTPRVRVSAFTFFLLGFLDSGFSISEALTDNLWQLFVMSEQEKENLLIEASAEGWLHHSRAASILEVEPHYASLKEWVEHGLG